MDTINPSITKTDAEEKANTQSRPFTCDCRCGGIANTGNVTPRSVAAICNVGQVVRCPSTPPQKWTIPLRPGAIPNPTCIRLTSIIDPYEGTGQSEERRDCSPGGGKGKCPCGSRGHHISGLLKKMLAHRVKLTKNRRKKIIGRTATTDRDCFPADLAFTVLGKTFAAYPEVRGDKLAILEVTARLNEHVTYITMTLGAISGSGLFSWEQSVTTVDSPPIIAIMLLWITVICALGLPLSMIATDEIKDMQRAIEECDEPKFAGSGRAMLKKVTQKVAEKESNFEDDNVSCDSDLEACGTLRAKCRCIRCASEMRKPVVYTMLFVPPLFAVVAFTMFFVFLFALICATENKGTVLIVAYGCVVPILVFFGALVFFIRRVLTRTAKTSGHRRTIHLEWPSVAARVDPGDRISSH